MVIRFFPRLHKVVCACSATLGLFNSCVASHDQHPFLFFAGEEVSVFRERVENLEWSEKAYQEMRLELEENPEVLLPPPNSNIRREWRPIMSRIPRRASYAAFLYLMDGEQKHLDYARDYLLQYAKHFDERINFHHIDHKDGIVIYETGSLGVHSAWTYDMLYNVLSPEERELIEHNLLRAIVETIRATTEGVNMYDLWAGKSENTGRRARDYDWGPGMWNGTMFCNTGIAAIGFALRDRELVDHAVSNWKIYLERDMLADGMWQEEDYYYSRFCYNSMMTVAEMAYQYGYEENLYEYEVVPRPVSQWDRSYVDAPITEAERGHQRPRTLRKFLDAQIDYQYPTLGAGNWGWQTNKAPFLDTSTHVTMYSLGYLRYGNPEYAWLLEKMDRSQGDPHTQALIGPILYGGVRTDRKEKPSTQSRWYEHAKWIALKSIEGPDYWGSDAIYAFMAYGGDRTKAIRALSVDLFAYGKVIAPRVAKNSRLQAHDRDYYLTDDSWNAYLVDGQGLSLMKDKIERTWMRFQEFTPELKISQACIDVRRNVRPSSWYDEVSERIPGMDRIDSRLLALTEDYLVDILDIRFQQPQEYLRTYEWIWHAFGELELDGVRDGELTRKNWSATWRDPTDGIGLKTVMLGHDTLDEASKVSIRQNAYGPYLKVFRGTLTESFVAIHEPFKGAPEIDRIERIGRSDGAVSMKIVDEGNFTDYFCLAYAADTAGFENDGEFMSLNGHYGYLRLSEDRIIGRGNIESFRIRAPESVSVVLNGQAVAVDTVDGYVHYKQ